MIQKYVSIHSNPEVFDLVVNHRTDFQQSIGDSVITDYLLNNYLQFINWRKPKKVNKLAKKYPFDSIPEAIQAIETYRRNKKIQTSIEVADN